MTVDEIVDAALTRGTEFGLEFPSARSVYYARISQRARELQQMLADWNPALVSVDEVVDVLDGLIDLNDLSTTLTEVRAVLVEDAGTSEYDAGATVNIIPPEDQSGHLPPRVYFRGSLTLVGVGADLDGLVSVRVFGTDGGADDLEGADEPATPPAFHGLLVVDLARFMGTLLATTPNANTSALMAVLDAEERDRLTSFARFALNYGGAISSRFGPSTRPPAAPPETSA